MSLYHRQEAVNPQASVAERPSALPPANGGSPMAEPTLEYRIWQNGMNWHWQVMEVMDDAPQFLASGVAESSRAARTAAFKYCLKQEGK